LPLYGFFNTRFLLEQDDAKAIVSDISEKVRSSGTISFERSERAIAQMLGVSNRAVHRYVRRARLVGLSWRLPAGMDDEGLELLLFPAPMAASQSNCRPLPDCAYVESPDA
jgi:hypothetical protein